MPTPKSAASKGYSSSGLNPGPPPWAKSAPKRTVLSGQGAAKPKLQSKIRQIMSQGVSLGGVKNVKAYPGKVGSGRGVVVSGKF